MPLGWNYILPNISMHWNLRVTKMIIKTAKFAKKKCTVLNVVFSKDDIVRECRLLKRRHSYTDCWRLLVKKTQYKTTFKANIIFGKDDIQK